MEGKAESNKAEQKRLRDLIAKVAEEAGLRNYNKMAQAVLGAGYKSPEEVEQIIANLTEGR